MDVDQGMVPHLHVENLGIDLMPGSIIQMGRFDSERWEVHCGWFSFSGNRKINGWYVQSLSDPTKLKPIQETDLHDIYLVGR